MLSSVLDHLLNAPTWAVLVIAGALVFAEDALFVGFVLPGETAAVVAGVAAKLGHAPLAAVLITVVVAAIAGDSVGYEVGRLVGTRILALKVFDKSRRRLDDAQESLARRGGSAVFLGRWVAFLRAVMPALAGTSRMRYRTFLAYNAAGGITWGTAVVLIGYLAGASYKTVESRLGTGAAAVVGVIALVALIVWRVRKRRAEALYEQG